MTRFERLQRSVAPALRWIAGGRASASAVGDDSIKTFGEVAGLAWPIAIAMLGDTAMGLVDTKLVAGLGRDALGGVGIGVTAMYLVYAVVFGFMRGVKVRTSYMVGEGTPDASVVFALAGVCAGALAGLATMVLMSDASGLFVRIGVDAAMIPYARDFLAARTLGAPSAFVVAALVQHRQGLGDSRTPMTIALVGNVVNGFFAAGLIYGKWGLPALGVSGAGIGTALAETLQALTLLAVLSPQARAFVGKGAANAARAMSRALSEISAIGLPTGLQFGCEMLAFFTFTAIIGGLGAHEVAAHQIAMALARVSFLPGLAVAEAGSVLVGTALGARDLRAADRVVRVSMFLAAGFMSLCGLGFALFGGAFGRAFTGDVEVARVVGNILLVAALFQTLDAVTMVLRSALRAAKDVRMVAFIGIGLAWVCVPTAAYVLGRQLGMGAVGGWLGFLAETSFATVLFWRRWVRGAWRARFEGSRERAPSLSSALGTPRPV